MTNSCPHKYVEYRKPKGGKGVFVCKACGKEQPVSIEALFEEKVKP